MGELHTSYIETTRPMTAHMEFRVLAITDDADLLQVSAIYFAFTHNTLLSAYTFSFHSILERSLPYRALKLQALHLSFGNFIFLLGVLFFIAAYQVILVHWVHFGIRGTSRRHEWDCI